MASVRTIEPDLQFIEEIARYGGRTCRQCFQCATCSVVCQLAPDEHPFPRQEMIQAQWGLKDPLVADPNIWLCHQCNDCSIHCPRGARPGQLMAAIRAFSFKHWAWPAWLGSLVARPRYLPLTLGAALVLVLALIFVSNGGSLAFPEPDAHGRVEYGRWIPHAALNIFFTALTLFVVVAFVRGTRAMWKAMEAHLPAGTTPQRSLAQAFWAGASEFLAHRRFSQCGVNKARFWGHLLTFYGFAGLLVATAIVVLLILVDPSSYPIRTLTHPLKVLGNLSMIALLAGLTLIIYKRLTDDHYAGSGTAVDWTFLWVIYGVAWTGLFTQMFRMRLDLPAVAYPMYVAHLVLVFYLIVYAPYSKFGHMVYRAVAIVFAKRYRPE